MKSQQWESYEKAAERGPLHFVLKLIVFVLIIGLVVAAIGYPLGWFGEAANVAQQEFGAKALLTKYEWFKDSAAALEKKQADISVYESRIKNMADGYKALERQKWPRDDREQYNTWSSEVAGVKASYNSLAAEYNAQMAKFNWRFVNAGELPRGADSPLPREFKPYINQ